MKLQNIFATFAKQVYDKKNMKKEVPSNSFKTTLILFDLCPNKIEIYDRILLESLPE